MPEYKFSQKDPIEYCYECPCFEGDMGYCQLEYPKVGNDGYKRPNGCPLQEVAK